MCVILIIMGSAMFSLTMVMQLQFVSLLLFVLWGATGWASLAPQQHRLLRLQTEQAATAVALNGSANYLGSAVGSALGGIAILAGWAPVRLPYAAGILVLMALAVQQIVTFELYPKKKGEMATIARKC